MPDRIAAEHETRCEQEKAEKYAADFRMMQNLGASSKTRRPEDPKTRRPSPLQRGLVLNIYCQAYERVNGMPIDPQDVLKLWQETGALEPYYGIAIVLL
jgi:hypothetical protein